MTASRPWLGISTPSWLIKSDTPHLPARAAAGNHHRRRGHGRALHGNLAPHQPETSPPSSASVMTGPFRPASDSSFQPIRQAITQSDHLSAAINSERRLGAPCWRATR